MRLRRFALVSSVLVTLLAGCSDRNPPPPVPAASASPHAHDPGERPVSSRETRPAGAAAVDPVDPAEPGITDLARLARYVFRTIRTHGEVCSFDNPLRERIDFVLHVEVKDGRMTRVHLGQVGVGAVEQARTLPQGQWPPELVRYVECLEPHLRELKMDPSPGDGTFEPAYQYPGKPGGRPAR